MSLYCVEWSFSFERKKMKKEFRLKNNQEIGKIVLKRQKATSLFYNLYYIYNQKETKVAVVAGKKCGNAVKRNYQKRIMREIIKPYLCKIKNVHAVLVAKENVVNSSYIEKKEDLEKIVSKMIERIKNEKK